MDNYASYCFVDELDELLVDLNAAENRLRAEGRTIGADLLVRAYVQLKADLLALGITVSTAGTDILRRHEHDTRVRPDTLGGGGPRLEDYLVAEPIPTVKGQSWGSVGIANESLLDGNVPWWVTNEEGSSALLGHRIFGVFTGQGEARPPSSEEFRVHPLFAPGRGGSGVISNPIPERRFVESAVPEIQALWHAEYDAAKAVFDAQIDTALLAP